MHVVLTYLTAINDQDTCMYQQAEPSTKILSVGCDGLPKELTGRSWLAVADLLSCRVQDEDEEDMSGQVMVGQAAPGTLPE